jgi:hypothetical protein
MGHETIRASRIGAPLDATWADGSRVERRIGLFREPVAPSRAECPHLQQLRQFVTTIGLQLWAVESNLEVRCTQCAVTHHNVDLDLHVEGGI